MTIPKASEKPLDANGYLTRPWYSYLSSLTFTQSTGEAQTTYTFDAGNGLTVTNESGNVSFGLDWPQVMSRLSLRY